MNIDNLNKLIAHLGAQPPERINMAYSIVDKYSCGTCGCIAGHARLIWKDKMERISSLSVILGIPSNHRYQLTIPDGWMDEADGASRYPANRVIATLKRLRDTYLSTGQVVVDWGPEPGEEPKQAWSAPQFAEVIAPALPAELTSLLRNTVEA